MGQKFSIDVKFDEEDANKPVVAGTSLKGKVSLRVKRKLDPSDLTLHLLGKEITLIQRPGKSPLKDEKTIARAVTKLRESGGRKIERGTYLIPFDFVLPASLPSTTKFPKCDGRKYSGRISYYLRASLGDFHLDREFKVQAAPISPTIVPCVVHPSTHELKTLGFLNKGFLSVGASVENSRVGKGQVLRVAVASRNETSVDLNRVRVKLVELIEYRSQGQESSIKRDLDKIKDIDLPGLDKMKSAKEQVRLSIRQGFSHSVDATYRAIYEDLLSGNNQFDIVVPKTARESYDGNLIKISHYLKVTFFTKALLENPSTKIPIVIGSPRSQEQSEQVARQANEPLATVIFDNDISDDATTVEVGARADFVPMANAVLLDGQRNSTMTERPSLRSDDDNIVIVASDRVHLYHDGNLEPDQGSAYRSLPMAIPSPTAPTESMLNLSYEDATTESLDDQMTAPYPQADNSSGANQNMGYSPFQMYGQSNDRRDRLPSYSYDTESGMTSIGADPQRLGGASPGHDDLRRQSNAQWLLERLLQELNGSIHDYEVVATKIREQGYKELFATLTPVEFRSIIGHVTMSHQVQVALLLAKQLVLSSSFTCAHCAGALQKTSDYFRSNMVETLLPYCNDLHQNSNLIKEQLSQWELVVTANAFDAALA